MAKHEVIRKRILRLTGEYYQKKFGKKCFDSGKDWVHYAGRVFDSKELINLIDASLDFFLTAGRYAEQFELQFARVLGLSNALLVNSGSSANLVALTALTSPKLKDRRLKPGDEVITTACGFPTTLNPILQNQLVPVFVDVNLGNYTAISEQISEAICSKTKAIMLAHTLGNPCNLDVIMDLVKKYNLWFVEDNCDALGSRYRERLTGTFGHFSTFSFYPAHHITMGEGGCVATADDDLAKIARSIRDWGRDCYCSGGKSNSCRKRYDQRFGSLPLGYDHKYVYSHIGYNLKLTDMQAAIGCAQLKKLEEFIVARKVNFVRLKEIFEPYFPWFILPQSTEHADPSWFGFPVSVRCGTSFTRTDFTRYLEAHHIETRNLFAGNLLRHPAYSGIPHRIVKNLVNSDFIATNTFFLGLYPGIGNEQLEHIKIRVENFMRSH